MEVPNAAGNADRSLCSAGGPQTGPRALLGSQMLPLALALHWVRVPRRGRLPRRAFIWCPALRRVCGFVNCRFQEFPCGGRSVLKGNCS